jgi:type VI secretion system secreted protein Hcp
MFDIFLKLDGIPGDSTDQQHLDWIEVQSYSFGFSGGQVDGSSHLAKMQWMDVNLTKFVDRASCRLLDALIGGGTIQEAIMEVCASGGEPRRIFSVRSLTFLYHRCSLMNILLLQTSVHPKR